ncbi:PAS domain-containing sensor histidine kinase [Hymenobacter sp. BT175]|uniref:PAS domain-containing protein n=1 Tax=Hymenobacter translucens TaxID=2886507 RepID=UPI001D0F22A8|nr:PAS domain-containing protein [Hymenobacter translucens]MCC2548599.1 PAS domain-containing sensor histidine kinase [Hymenobacter translucens]
MPPPDLLPLPVFNALPGANLLLSPEWRIVAASDDYLAATLTQRDALVGQYLFDAFPDNPDTPEANSVANVRASLTQVMATGQPHEMAPQHYDVPDPGHPGRFVERHWQPRHTPVLDAAGQVQFFIQSVQDITARRVAERLLHDTQASAQEARADAEAQRQRLHDVLMVLPAQVVSFRGPDHVYELVNPGYQQLFPTRTLRGLPLRQALPELEGQGIQERLDHVYHTGVTHFEPEMELWADLTGTGRLEQRYFSVLLQPLRDSEGRIDGLLSFAYDITEQVLARRQVQQLNHELETRVQQRTQEVEQARAEAEEQRNRLLRLFGQAPAQINIFQGPDHIWTLVHPSTQELLPNRLLLGLPRREALPEFPEEQHEPFDRVYRTGQLVHDLEAIRRIDRYQNGELHEIYFDATFQPMFDAAGQVEGVMSFAVNVTERVRARRHAETLQAEVLAAAQRQVQEREALYHMLADTPAAVALLRGPEHRFEYVNAAYQQLFPERQLTGKSVAEALPETREAGFLTILDRVYQTGETFFGQELPMRVLPGDGRPVQQVYYTFTYQAYRENDQIAGISIFAFEVTEQVQARQQREAERQQLHRLFMEAPTPIVILDGPDLVFQLVNPAYQRIFPSRVLLGKPVLEALPEITGAPIYQHLRGVYDTGKTFVAQELPMQLARRDDGPLEDLYFTFTYQARHNAQGTPDGVLVFAHEVTDQVQARRVVEESDLQARALAQELADANQQLVRTNVDLDNFIYTASHDLKAPISNIEGLLYLLQEELPVKVAQDVEVAPTLTRMLDAVERFKRTIDHLTEVSKLQKEHEPATTLVNLAAIVEDVRQDLLPQLQDAGAKLFADVAATPPVQFSEKNLRSVVYNLLSNAVKYRHPDRPAHVEMRAHVRPGHTVLEVHDNGLGLDSDHLPRLFNMFQRFHDHVEGTGIGLYMVKRMVENAGGRIEVHSQLGAGTTFFVFLPHAPSPAGHYFPAFVAS